MRTSTDEDLWRLREDFLHLEDGNCVAIPEGDLVIVDHHGIVHHLLVKEDELYDGIAIKALCTHLPFGAFGDIVEPQRDPVSTL